MNLWPKSCLCFCHVWMKLLEVAKKIVPFSESFWSNLKQFLRMIDLTAWLWGWNVRVNGMRSMFSFSAVWLSINYLGTVVTRLNDRNRIATFFEKLTHCLWCFGKSESSLHKRRSLKDCEKGMEFLTCDHGCEDEYSK